MIKNIYSISALALILMNPVKAEQSLQSHETIYETVKDYIEQHIDDSYEYEVSVLPIDDLLTLPECIQQPLEADRKSVV